MANCQNCGKQLGNEKFCGGCGTPVPTTISAAPAGISAASARKDAPKCMLLLMCPEQDENSITRVVEAKRKKRIDDFVFYDVTIEYLISKLMSMYPSNGKYEMLRGEHNYGSN